MTNKEPENVHEEVVNISDNNDSAESEENSDDEEIDKNDAAAAFEKIFKM